MGCIKSKQGLTQEDLEFLKAHTRYDENTIKEWYKGFKQDCPNGRLTPVKFVDMYKMFFPSGNAEQFCDHVFRTFDTDKNGYIDFKEFLLAIDVTSAGTAEEKLKWAFRQDDDDITLVNYLHNRCVVCCTKDFSFLFFVSIDALKFTKYYKFVKIPQNYIYDL